VSRLTHDEYALLLARAASARSEDPYNRVGCALMRHDKTVASLGYNGAPPGVELDWSSRNARRDKVIHAEANALRFVRPGEVELMATTMMPCKACVLLAKSYGIERVIFEDELDAAVYDIPGTLWLAGHIGLKMEKR